MSHDHTYLLTNNIISSEDIDNVYIIVLLISSTVSSFHVMGHTSRCSTIFVNTYMVRRHITHCDNESTSDIIPLHLRYSSHQPVTTSTSSSLLFEKVFLCDRYYNRRVYVYFVFTRIYNMVWMNEWVLITPCKQLVWSTRIGRIVRSYPNLMFVCYLGVFKPLSS